MEKDVKHRLIIATAAIVFFISGPAVMYFWNPCDNIRRSMGLLCLIGLIVFGIIVIIGCIVEWIIHGSNPSLD